MAEIAYAALIGDLVSSRDQADRSEVQAALGVMVRELNSELGAEDLAAPLVQTAGDEVQALLRRPSRVVYVVQELTDRLAGSGFAPGEAPSQEIAFGVGWGGVTTASPPAAPAQAETPALIDGPCFHHARAALEEARRQRSWVRFSGFPEPPCGTLNTLFELMRAIRSSWATKQKYYTYQARRPGSRKALAEDLHVSPSVISESLKAAHFSAICEGEAEARKLLDELVPHPS
jgi:hypothetical protein